MSVKVKARIHWLPPEAGGRRETPPGPRYSTVARFEAVKDRWPEEAWSIVAEIPGPPDASGCMIVNLWFLFENAPMDLLRPGSRFDLFEGRKLVAHGEVVSGMS